MRMKRERVPAESPVIPFSLFGVTPEAFSAFGLAGRPAHSLRTTPQSQRGVQAATRALRPPRRAAGHRPQQASVRACLHFSALCFVFGRPAASKRASSVTPMISAVDAGFIHERRHHSLLHQVAAFGVSIRRDVLESTGFASARGSISEVAGGLQAEVRQTAGAPSLLCLRTSE